MGFRRSAVGAVTLPNAIPVALGDGESKHFIKKDKKKYLFGYLKGDMVILQPGRRDSKNPQDSNPLWIFFTDTFYKCYQKIQINLQM